MDYIDYSDILKEYIIKNKRLEIKVKPNSRTNEIIDFKNNVFHISICKEPENNKANLELIKFLKKITKFNLKISSGFTSKNKIVKLDE